MKVVVNNAANQQYASAFTQIVDEFVERFPIDRYSVEDVLSIVKLGWNTANMMEQLPDAESLIEMEINENGEDSNDTTLREIIGYKKLHFPDYLDFIYSCEYNEADNRVAVSHKSPEEFAKNPGDFLDYGQEQYESEVNESNWDTGFIDRSAIIIQAKQPFLDWYNSLYPGDGDDMQALLTQKRIYLVAATEDEKDLENWLNKKYDKIFTEELEGWHTNKKQWPQKRSYKMFKLWFDVEVIAPIFDLQKIPVSKNL